MTAPRSFALYPVEKHWWSFNDYGAVVDVVRELAEILGRRPRVVEFGPGSSTLSLVEGGAGAIDTYEDRSDWLEVHQARLPPLLAQAGYRDVDLRFHLYTWTDPLAIPGFSEDVYDLALVDGPRGSDHRMAVIRFALEHAAAVLAPTENNTLRADLRAFAEAEGLDLMIRETGPLSGSFAVLRRPPIGVTLEASRADGPGQAAAAAPAAGLEHAETGLPDPESDAGKGLDADADRAPAPPAAAPLPVSADQPTDSTAAGVTGLVAPAAPAPAGAAKSKKSKRAAKG